MSITDKQAAVLGSQVENTSDAIRLQQPQQLDYCIFKCRASPVATPPALKATGMDGQSY